MSGKSSVEVKFATLRRISPSGFTALSLCPLRAACIAAGQPTLLPQSPASTTGTISHKVLEAAGRAKASSEADTFIKVWDEIAEVEEAKMQLNTLQRRFIPLRQHDLRYEVIRWQTCQRASFISQRALLTKRSPLAGYTQSHYEEFIQSSDGTIAGVIDFVQETQQGAILRDYKTGTIWDDSHVQLNGHPAVKQEYQVQLKLYAALWWTKTGMWPLRLELVPLDCDPIEVIFDHAEYLALLESAQATLANTNDHIRKVLQELPPNATTLATASPSICRYCSFRPGCPAYWNARGAISTTEVTYDWPVDIRGTLQKKQMLGNGLLMLQLQTEQGDIALVHLSAGLTSYPDLANVHDGDWIEIYNLSSKDGEKLFSETKLTAAYSCSESEP